MKRLVPAALAILLAVPGALMAEIIYMKDGQVVRGNITAEDGKYVTVKTKFQVRRIRREHIERIMYGKRDMEPVHILLNDGRIVSGFLVDQDAEKVIFREKQDSPVDTTIPKSDIKQMSREEIVPLKPDVYVRAGMLRITDSGGANLDMGPLVVAGIGMNITMIKNARLLFELGYAKLDSKTNAKQYLQFIPLTVGAGYAFVLGGSGDPFLKRMSITPRLSVGITMADFEDGEGAHSRGYDLCAAGGAGLWIEIVEDRIAIGAWADYYYFMEQKSSMGGIAGGVAVSFRF